MKNEMKNRPGKNKYYLKIAQEVSSRSTCRRAKIGAVIVRDDQIIATGYTGAPRKAKDCFQRRFCLREKLGIPHGQRYELCRSVHAEMNAVINAARAGVSLLGGSIYIYGQREPDGKPLNAFPCFICKKIIINAGLKQVVSSIKTGGIKIFSVSAWIKEWQKKDIIDDQYQYTGEA